MLIEPNADGGPMPQLRRARLVTATLSFANGCGLGSWLPHIPDVKIWHDLSEVVLGLALLAIACVAFMAEGAMGDWSAIYIRMDLGAAPATAVYGFAAFSLTMAIGRLTGDRLVARFGAAGIVIAGALIGALSLGAALLAGHPAAAVLGFAGMGLGLANIAPIVFSAAGRLPQLAPGIGIAAVSTAGYRGFLAGPPLIGLVAEASGLPVALGLVAATVGLMVLGAAALPRQTVRAAALAG
jgi:MFS family permease